MSCGVDILIAINTVMQALFMLVCTLAAWLHLACGLSLVATARCLKFINIIVCTAVELGYLLAQRPSLSSPIPPPSIPPLSLPTDVRKAISALSVEPNIMRSICCPKCLAKYDLDSLPQVCLRRETPRSKVCGEKLWTTRSTRGGPRTVPRRLYCTQDFESWLEYLLSRPGIEDLINKSYEHQPSHDIMHSIWDSPAWKSLGNYTTTPHNLTFSYYIDWFNPFTNKIAGKTASCGAIMMFCLNLPHELQRLPENTFFAGITPPPKEPTSTTITAITDPIIDQFEAMWHGRVIRTYRHPGGIRKRAAILPGIGDLLAIRKAMGFAAVRSHNFCSFCKLRYSEIGSLDYAKWQPRVGLEVLQAALEWKEATTKKTRKEIFDKHGVRWSSLNRLAYRDPVRHTVLGLMHNWIEGILQHHVRVRWGIGIVPPVDEDVDDNRPSSPMSDTTEYLDIDSEIINEEVQSIWEESQSHIDTPSHLRRLRSEAFIHINAESNDVEVDSDGDNDADFQPDDESDEDDGDENAWNATCVFTASQLSKIHACLSDTVIPGWIERPPTNLGAKSHGKLKADQWFTLFTIFLPLIIPEIWLVSSNKRHAALLENFYDLVTCTNIVCSYAITEASADAYRDHYIKYRRSLDQLFPNIPTRPNHHYAMHNPELMKFWGPLIKLSEFPYEQHNGRLQKIKTNSHLCAYNSFLLLSV